MKLPCGRVDGAMRWVPGGSRRRLCSPGCSTRATHHFLPVEVLAELHDDVPGAGLLVPPRPGEVIRVAQQRHGVVQVSLGRPVLRRHAFQVAARVVAGAQVQPTIPQQLKTDPGSYARPWPQRGGRPHRYPNSAVQLTQGWPAV